MFNWFLSVVVVVNLVIVVQESQCKGNFSEISIDQRQTGKYNIHLTIKDVAIIEIGDNDFAEDNHDDSDDYYYDDGDLTVKPWFSTTTKSTTTTTVASNNVTMSTEKTTTPKLIGNSSASETNFTTSLTTTSTTAASPTSASTTAATSTAATAKTAPDPIPDENNPWLIYKPEHIPVKVIMEPVLIPKIRTSQRLPQTRRLYKDSQVFNLKSSRRAQRNRRKCPIGQIRDELGYCRKKRSSSGPTTLFLEKLFSIFRALPEQDGEP